MLLEWRQPQTLARTVAAGDTAVRFEPADTACRPRAGAPCPPRRRALIDAPVERRPTPGGRPARFDRYRARPRRHVAAYGPAGPAVGGRRMLSARAPTGLLGANGGLVRASSAGGALDSTVSAASGPVRPSAGQKRWDSAG